MQALSVDSLGPGSSGAMVECHGNAVQMHWRLSSVNRPLEAMIVQWLQGRPDTHFRQLAVADLPLAISVGSL